MATKVEKSITVDVPVSTAYNQWTQFEEFPRFMGGVQQVEQLEDDRLHWVAEIGGVKREWYALILEQRRDEKVAWAATEGATNAGAVYFAPVGPARTTVTLELEYEPEGVVEKVGDALNIVGRRAEADLEKFKAFIEGRGAETGAWRGDLEGATTGTPGVETTTSQGDSGKAGVSAKAAAAGVAGAAAVGVAAAAAASRSHTEETPEAAPQTAPATTPIEDVPVTPEVDTYRTPPVADGGDALVGEEVPDLAVVADDLAVEEETPPTDPGRPSGP
jgi:carbon monoxide dehydrogenase subunit G